MAVCGNRHTSEQLWRAQGGVMCLCRQMFTYTSWTMMRSRWTKWSFPRIPHEPTIVALCQSQCSHSNSHSDVTSCLTETELQCLEHTNDSTYVATEASRCQGVMLAQAEAFSLVSLLLPPQRGRGWQALCQDLAASCCNEQGVLKLRRALTVCCDSRPAVWPCHISVGAHVDHGLNCEDLPFFHDSYSLHRQYKDIKGQPEQQ